MRFEPNPALAAELQAQPEFRLALIEQALAVKAQADVLRRSIPDGGAWMPRRGLETIEVDGTYVLNTDHAAAIIEWGSKNSPPYGLLRRAVRAAGLRLGE